MYNSYSGPCNILNLLISRHKKIDVLANNSKTWDYTNPLLPLIEPQQMQQLNGGANGLNNNQGHTNNMMSKAGNGGIGDHPLLPMPMNMAAAAAAVAAAAAAANSHHSFSTAAGSPFMAGGGQQQHAVHQGHQGQQMQGGHQHNQHHQHAFSQNMAAQSVSGYPMQSMDTRPAVVQVANFPEQVI